MRPDFSPPRGWPAHVFHTRKKVIGFSGVGLTKQELELPHYDFSRETKQNKLKYFNSNCAAPDPQAV